MGTLESIDSYRKSHMKSKKESLKEKRHHPLRPYKVIFMEKKAYFPVIRTVIIESVTSLHAAEIAKKNFGKIDITNVELIRPEE